MESHPYPASPRSLISIYVLVCVHAGASVCKGLVYVCRCVWGFLCMSLCVCVQVRVCLFVVVTEAPLGVGVGGVRICRHLCVCGLGEVLACSVLPVHSCVYVCVWGQGTCEWQGDLWMTS